MARSAAKSASAPASGKEQKRPSSKELTFGLIKVLGDDSKIMEATLQAGRIFANKDAKKIIAKVMASIKAYPWKPTVPPCLAGWIQSTHKYFERETPNDFDPPPSIPPHRPRLSFG